MLQFTLFYGHCIFRVMKIFFERKLRIPKKCLIRKHILSWSSQGHKVTIGIEIEAPFLCTHQMKGEFSRSPNGYFFSTCIISDASTILST